MLWDVVFLSVMWQDCAVWLCCYVVMWKDFAADFAMLCSFVLCDSIMLYDA